MAGFVTSALRFFGLGGLNRQEGQQLPVPATYSSPSAAPVNFDTAMAVSAFWASARLLSETVAAMPIKCYETDGKTRNETTNNKLWRLLNYMPNRYQTRTEFIETLMLNLVTWGNAYIGVSRDVRGKIISLNPLMSSQMNVCLQADGSIVYEYRDLNGAIQLLSEHAIWHIKLFGNGVIGLSPLAYARQSLGVAIATEDRISALAKSGGKQSGILTIDKVLTPEQRKAVRDNFADLTNGPGDKLFVLEAGMGFESTSLSPADMEMLQNRRFQVEDIARFMGVPSVLINDTSGSTVWGSGVQQIVDGFYKLNLRPYLERIESSIKRHLMMTKEWDSVDIEFDFDALLRADQNQRYDANQKAINSGQLTPNEARMMEGRESMEGGDNIYLNGTLVPADPALRANIQPNAVAEVSEDENQVTES